MSRSGRQGSSPLFHRWSKRLSSEGAYLLPLRLFIGLGWLRAGLEKLFYEDVLQGLWLSTFFGEQLAAGAVVFPLYARLINSFFLPQAALVSVTVVALELLIGLAILGGAFSNLALLVGIGLNLNFVLAGVPNPSAFYLVIQAVLIVVNTGAVLGIDARLSRRAPFVLLAAQPQFEYRYRRRDRRALLVLSLIFFFAVPAALPFVRDYSPHAIDDPAMILVITSLMMSSTFFVAHLRLPPLAKEIQTLPARALRTGRLEQTTLKTTQVENGRPKATEL